MKKDNFYGDEDGYLTHLKLHIDARDPVALYQCINRATYQFQMEQTEKIRFIGRCVERCLQLGAVPCVPGPPIYEEEWVAEPKYGMSPAKIHHAVRAEWIADGTNQLEPWTGVWFALPSQVVPLDQATPKLKP